MQITTAAKMVCLLETRRFHGLADPTARRKRRRADLAVFSARVAYTKNK